jgi:hypothetical protein
MAVCQCGLANDPATTELMMAKLPDDADIDAATAAFEAYFTALGKVAHEWNHMQEELGKVFCIVSGLDNSMGMALWHALKSDRSQRDLLDAAIRTAASDEAWAEKFPAAEQGVVWLVKQVNILAERRNDAIHAPCSIVPGEADLEIFAVSFFSNPRAKNLRGKDILQEFAWYEQCAETLKRHARELQAALADAHLPWPERPQLPTQGQKSAHRDQRRRPPPK